MNNQILNILEKLINFKSVTPNGRDAIEYIAELLEEHGFKCDIAHFGEDSQKVTNLYAIYGNHAPNICFAGHVDVVPPMNEDLWQFDPFKMTITENENIYGRGTVDMKGAIACALAASINFIKDHHALFDGAISFLLTSDEEGEAKYGTKLMLEHIKHFSPKIDFCILGEPTTENQLGDTIKIGRRGSINFSLKIIGKQGHVAYPNKAQNPLPILIDILNDLKSFKFDEGSKFFEASNLEVTSIDTGNNVTNIIPASGEAKFNIRFNEQHTGESLVEKITEIILKHTDKYELEYKCSSNSFIQEFSPRMQNFTSIVQDICKTKPRIETNGGTSDARFIHKYTEIVEFGLNSDLAHKINEYTKISDLQSLYSVYYNSLVKFLKNTGVNLD